MFANSLLRMFTGGPACTPSALPPMNFEFWIVTPEWTVDVYDRWIRAGVKYWPPPLMLLNVSASNTTLELARPVIVVALVKFELRIVMFFVADPAIDPPLMVKPSSTRFVAPEMPSVRSAVAPDAGMSVTVPDFAAPLKAP